MAAMDDDFSLGDEATPPPEEIVCVDCGGPCHLISYPRENGLWFIGDIATYRCRDCRDRWDLVVGED
jgi:hypothetical protein